VKLSSLRVGFMDVSLNMNKYILICMLISIGGCTSYPGREKVTILDSAENKPCSYLGKEENCLYSISVCKDWFKKRATLIKANTVEIKQNKGKYFSCNAGLPLYKTIKKVIPKHVKEEYKPSSIRVTDSAYLKQRNSNDLVFSQNPYIREGSIGKQKELPKTSQIDPLSFRPIEKWVGEKFIFLPTNKSLQRFGYQNFSHGFNGSTSFNHPTYKECVGRIGTIVKASDSYYEGVAIKMDDNGQIYTSSGTNSINSTDNIDHIAPVADIDYARKKWLGTTLWYRSKGLSTYNEDTEKFGTIKIKKYSPVKVINIVLGWSAVQPIRFILQTPSGDEGFVDFHLSGTNIPYMFRDLLRFEDYFFTKDPKKIYKWFSKVWTAIEAEKVFIGMTAEQARMSWGKPDDVNKTITGNVKYEQWVYAGSYLYFKNDILSSIQN